MKLEDVLVERRSRDRRWKQMRLAVLYELVMLLQEGSAGDRLGGGVPLVGPFYDAIACDVAAKSWRFFEKTNWNNDGNVFPIRIVFK